MSDPYFQSLFAERIGGAMFGKGTGIYKFEKIKRAKRKALADHPERKLLDFGIGENDAMAPESVRRVMAEEINKPENRGYADNGPPMFKEAVARLMQREFGVALDPATEVNHCIGSKTAQAVAGTHRCGARRFQEIGREVRPHARAVDLTTAGDLPGRAATGRHKVSVSSRATSRVAL